MDVTTARRMLGNTVVGRWALRRQFRGSRDYWESRYAAGGTSGSGSYGPAAEWKANIVNGWVTAHSVRSVVDLGCGDGNQLSLAGYPRYLGLDLSASAVRQCIERFRDDPSKSFLRFDPETTADPAGWLRADLALSMEVLFHLVEDDVRQDYLRRLFASAERFVAICSTDTDEIPSAPHERHEPFTRWVDQHQPDWQVIDHFSPPEGVPLLAEMWLYGRRSSGPVVD